MKLLGLRAAALFICCIFFAAAQAENGVHITYSEPLQHIDFIRHSAHLSTDAQKSSESSLRSIQFDAFGKRFDIDVRPNHALLSAVKRLSLARQVEIYRGEISGHSKSWVRLVVSDGVPRGMLWDGREMYAIDVLDGDSNNAIIFRLDDMQIAPGMLSCSAVGAPTNAGSLFRAIVNERSSNATSTAVQGPGATSQIDLAILGDFEFTSANGADAEVELVTRMNIVDGIFSTQLGVQLNINQIDVFPSSNDPFTDESDAGMLLDEVSDYRNVTPSQRANGLTHLFTGRTLDDTTVGIAYGGALCSRRFGAGLTQGDHGASFDSLIAAHEIGHNFGAPHDGTPGACESEAQTFLMAPSLNGSMTFSPCSITQMQDDIANASCISAIPSSDVSVVAGTLPAPISVGGSASIAFSVNSVGTDTANNVNLDVAMPSSVALVSASATAGSCTSGAGNVTCSLGSIASGSGIDVTIQVTAIVAGSADFVANVVADADANGANNQAAVQLPVNGAADLVATAAAGTNVFLNQSIAIQPVVGNQSGLVATGVTVTITPNAGLRVDTASWTPGSCSVASGVATCQANTLAAQSSNTLNIQLTGVSVGSQTYAISAAATGGDANPSNNDASGQVSVVATGTVPGPGSDGDGGGGSISLTILLLLGFVLVQRFVLANENRATGLSKVRTST